MFGGIFISIDGDIVALHGHHTSQGETEERRERERERSWPNYQLITNRYAAYFWSRK